MALNNACIFCSIPPLILAFIPLNLTPAELLRSGVVMGYALGLKAPEAVQTSCLSCDAQLQESLRMLAGTRLD